MARTPTYAGHLRIQCSGILGVPGTSYEIFSYGVSLADANGYANDAEYAGQLIDDTVAYHARNASAISYYARLTMVKVAEVLPDGKWAGGQPLVERIVDVPGGVNQSAFPGAPQVALAITLRTAINSARTRGRYFLPLPVIENDPSNGLVSAAAATAAGQSAAQWIGDLNNQVGVDTNGTRVVVASTYGQNTPVTSVSVGRVLDTIRSRRNAIREAYVDVPLPD